MKSWERLLTGSMNKEDRDQLVSLALDDPQIFKELLQIMLQDSNKRKVQNAAWLISYCTERNPSLIEPYLDQLISPLKTSNLDAVKRNIVRCLQYVSIPERLQGVFYDICFDYLVAAKESIAVRVFSMSILYNISRDIPELKQELLQVLQDLNPEESAGIKSKARKIIKELTMA